MGPVGGSGFNQIGRHGFQWDVLKSSLKICEAYRWIWFNSEWWTLVSKG